MEAISAPMQASPNQIAAFGHGNSSATRNTCRTYDVDRTVALPDVPGGRPRRWHFANNSK